MSEELSSEAIGIVRKMFDAYGVPKADFFDDHASNALIYAEQNGRDAALEEAHKACTDLASNEHQLSPGALYGVNRCLQEISKLKSKKGGV